jgi:hypothetical protein
LNNFGRGGWNYISDDKTMYELAIMGIKNKLVAKQWRDIKEDKRIKRDLAVKLKNMEMMYGKFSEECNRVDREMDNIINVELRNRAGKFKEFFEKNNEKPTRAFYKIGKSKLHNEDTTLIRDEDGNIFLDNKKQGEHIGNFYGRLYNKKLDKVFEFENYLMELSNRLGDEHIKLTDEEKNVMEREFTIMELEDSLRKSNMNSAAGWDGVYYLLIQ